MPIVVATRMVPSKIRYVPPFVFGSLRAAVQARRSPGFRCGALRMERGPAFWTLTVWEDGRAMASYRDSGAHGALVPNMARWAKEAAFTAWKADTTDLPSWSQAHSRLVERANFSDLLAPNEAHANQHFPPYRRAALNGPLRAPRRRRSRTGGVGSPGRQ